MATKVICPSDEEWAVLQSILSRCGRGAVLLSPEVRSKLRDLKGRNPDDVELTDYDFGGEPDLVFDLYNDPSREHFSLDAILEALEQAASGDR
jgi:hypothetical protein